MNHNAFAATTTCYCWTITRKDGVKLGFTDHDRDLIGDRFTVELSGQGAQLSRTQGRVFSRMCDARLGDARCGLSIDDFPSHTQCPRTFTACRDIFGNSVNFRGFPYLIGDDAMQSGPDGSPALDGGSRYAAIL